MFTIERIKNNSGDWCAVCDQSYAVVKITSPRSLFNNFGVNSCQTSLCQHCFSEMKKAIKNIGEQQE